MDHSSQQPENDPLLESTHSSSPVLLQEQSLAREQRLLRRITWLTLLLGIMIGILLTLNAGLWYVLTGAIPYAFAPTSPVIYRLLSPLVFVIIGVTTVLLKILQRLRRQLTIFRPDPFNFLQNMPANLNYGLFFIWIGSSSTFTLAQNRYYHLGNSCSSGSNRTHSGLPCRVVCPASEEIHPREKNTELVE